MTFWALFSYLKPHRLALWVILFLLIAETGISLLIPYLVGQVTQLIVEPQAFTTPVIWLVLGWVALLIVQMLLRYQTGFRTNRIGAKVLQYMSCHIHTHIHALPMQYFSDHRKGAIVALLSNDVHVISFFLTGVLTGVIPALLLIIGVSVMLWLLNPMIAAVIIGCVPLFFVLVRILSRAIKPLAEQVTHTQANGVALVADTVQQMSLLKAFNREASVNQAFANNAEQLFELRERMLHTQAFITPFIQLCIALGILGIVLLSVWHFQQHSIDLAQMITLLLYGALFAKPMGVLAGLYGQVQQAQGAASRIIGLLNTPIESHDEQLPRIDSEGALRGCVSLTAVGFAYPDRAPILHDIDFTVPAGTVGVIVGPNGMGKTTLLHLLMRFISPSEGRICIDGKDIANYQVQSIRQQIGLVSQDIALTHGTITDNIMYGINPEDCITEAHCHAAAKRAGVLHFSDTFVDGLATQIGENGVRLSGGQRQRIALARAILMQPTILLFDEPTSFADTLAQQEFMTLVRTTL